MAPSLEDLLAKDGFKNAKPKSGTKVPCAGRATSMPLLRGRGTSPPQSPSADPRIREGNTRLSKSMLWRCSPATGYREGINPIPGYGKRYSSEIKEHIGSSNGRHLNSVEVTGIDDSGPHNLQRRPHHKKLAGKAIVEEEWCRNKYIKHGPRRTSSSEYHLRKMRVSEGSHLAPRTCDLQSRRPASPLEGTSIEPRLDEAATRALVSILSGYSRCFFKDEDFRASLREKCYYCLRFCGKVESSQHNGGALDKLIDAIGTIERSVEEFPDPGELRRSCVQLSIITGKNSMDPKVSCPSGVPNSPLSACAHLYLSVIYEVQKKHRASARHLVRVFCDSPFEARTVLLPDLWERILLPHLSLLRAWYLREAEGISGTPCRQRKMRLLAKIYSDALDEGTRRIAVYYKEWLREGTECPNYPPIHMPYTPFLVTAQGLALEEVRSPSNSVSSQSLISRKLYESIFNRPRERDVTNEHEVGDGRQSSACGSSPCGGDVEDDEVGYYSARSTKQKEEHIKEDRPISLYTLHATFCANITKSAELVLEDNFKHGIPGIEL
uniref:Putative E3 ubiquitin-protein ligase LIN n=1 Tax=Anthurium amnicola TaxID=1678845 RepID=A0A1D1XUC0_9ARAE